MDHDEDVNLFARTTVGFNTPHAKKERCQIEIGNIDVMRETRSDARWRAISSKCRYLFYFYRALESAPGGPCIGSGYEFVFYGIERRKKFQL